MAAENFFGDSMTATVTTEDATPVSVPIASLKQVQATVTAEHVRLDSADSILRQAVAKRQLNVDVVIGVAAFDAVFIREWLGGSGAAAASPTDNNTVATFDIVGSMTSPGGTTITATIDSVYFPSLPVMDLQEGQWTVHNYEADGKTLTIS